MIKKKKGDLVTYFGMKYDNLYQIKKKKSAQLATGKADHLPADSSTLPER